jgi:hypothetical protein
MYLDNSVCVNKSVGVEMSPKRHEIAVDALRRLGQSVPPAATGIKFVNANALEADFSDATHLFLSSLCFPAAVVESLSIRLLTQAPELRAVAALSELDALEAAGWAKSSLDVQMSWGSAWVRVFKRPSGARGAGVGGDSNL